MRDLFFPRRLRRLSYFLRVLPLNAFLVAGLVRMDESAPPGTEEQFVQIGTVLLGIYLVAFVYLPRVRDCGLPPWSLVFGFIPFIGSAYGILLLFKRSRLSYSDPPPGGEAPAIITVAGSNCAGCGTRLIFASDGVITPSGEVLCKDCEAQRNSPPAK